MQNKELPHFGHIDISALQECYDAEMDWNGKTIRLDLNFEDTQMDEDMLDNIERFIKNIPSFAKQNMAYIQDNYEDEGGQVKEYISFHAEELGDDFFAQLKIDRHGANVEQQLLSKLSPVRVGIYPDGKYGVDCFAVFDYALNTDFSDELIVVNTDEDGNLDHISWES